MGRLTKRNKDGSVGINDFRYYNYDDFQKLATKLAHYEDMEEQGYKMVNIDKIVKQLEDDAMKWESVHSQGGFIDLDKAVEIIRTGGK